MRITSSVVAVIAVLIPAAAYAQAPTDDPMSLQGDDGQWVLPAKNYSATRFSTLNKITPENVNHLKVAWSMSTGTQQGHEGAPLVVGTTMYVHSSYPNNVFAIDLAKDGAIKWKYTPKQDARAVPVACCDLVHRGLNYSHGKILMSTLDAQVIALDANTGKEVWKVKNGDPSKGETITAAGLVVKDKYIVGISGGEFGVRGHVTAYDINTGKRVWRAYSTGPDEELLLAPDFNAANPHYGQKGQGTSTWQGDAWKRGGGTTWGWYSYDPTLNLFYYSTGNPGTWNPDQRLGDNKWSMTIWARNPDTGMAHWGYQMTPHDAWDYDGVNENILADLNIGGKKVQALVHFDRNGFGYTLDRTNGSLLVAEPFVHVNWATKIDKKTGRPVEDMSKRTKQGQVVKDICPNAMGGKDQQPAAFSPKTGLFYVPTNNMCMDYEATEVKYTAGAPYVGANVLMKPGPGGDPRRAHRVGRDHRQEGVGHQGAPAVLGRCARHHHRRGVLRNDGRLVQGRPRQDRQAAVEAQGRLRDHRRPDDVPRPRQEAVHRRVLRRRRLVRIAGVAGPPAQRSVRRARRRRPRVQERPRQGDDQGRHGLRVRAGMIDRLSLR